MFKIWVKLLPLFVVQWMSEKTCERINVAGMEVVSPFADVFFITDMKPDEEKEIGE